MPRVEPRIVRAKDAPAICGMDRRTFDREIRPLMTEYQIGVQGVGYKTVELDAALDDYLSRNRRPKGEKPWGEEVRKERQGSTKIRGRASGRLTSVSSASAFAKALERATSKRQN